MPRLFTSSIPRHLLRLRQARVSAPVRLASSSRSGGGAGKLVAGTSLVVTGAVGGVVGYAAYDQEFRKSIEELVPGSEDVLDLLLGGKSGPAPLEVDSKQRTIAVSEPLEEVVEEKLAVESVEAVEKPAVEVLEEPVETQETEDKVVEVEQAITETVSEVEITAPVADIPAPVANIPKKIVDEKVLEPEVEITEKIEAVIPETVSDTVVLEPVETVVLEEPEIIKPDEPSQAAEIDIALPAEVETAPPAEVETELPAVVETAPPAEVETALPAEAEAEIPAEVETAPPAEAEPTSPETEAETIKLDEPAEETESQEVGDPKQMEAEIVAPISTAIHLENSSLSEDLEDLCNKMKTATEEAVTLNQASSEAITTHMKVMQKVLEADLTTRNEAAWNEVFEAATTKSKTARLAESKSKEARNYITLAIDLIRAGRSNKVTCANPSLSAAEQAAEEALTNLDKAEEKIQTVQSDAKILEEYRDIVEEGRQQFHQEMASLMPDVKLGEKGSQLSEDELNLFITHAYRKVLHLQQELAKQQTLEQQRFKQALEQQELETRIAAEQKIERELARQRLDMETDHQVRVKTVREDMEKELRDQLRRQAAAHSDHLADVLAVQEMEMTRKHGHALEEKVSSLSTQHETSLASATGAVAGLRSAVEARAEDDKAALEAEKLWLAATTLSQAVKEGTRDAATWEERVKPLAKFVGDVKSASGAEDKFVSTVLSSIPSVALERGVFTEDSLKERFVKVEKLAKRVALIGDDGGSLFKFGLSYLQSLLLVNTTERTPSLADVEMDADQLSTQDIVCQARFCIDRGNFVQALQFMNQLKGEPRRVASDWLKETQLLLETQLAVEALLAHAACVGVETLPRP